MAEVPTHFPPRTYSSSFFLNVIPEEENRDEKGPSKRKQTSSQLLDCFLKTFISGSKVQGGNNKVVQPKITKDGRSRKFLLQTAEEVDLWKSSKHHQHHQSKSGSGTFKRWKRANNSVKQQNNNIKDASAEKCSSNNKDDDMSLLKFLAINALDLSAPASDVLLKSRDSHWFQLSGHPDSLAPAGPGTVWKKRSTSAEDTERTVYEHLTNDPLIHDIIPKYYREVVYEGETFIELQDLLHSFKDPYVIDIKMGTRTFLESEVIKTTARTDLYQKMVAIDPQAPTEEEHRNCAVTKLRYMQFRENQSSSCSLGFRIEAMKCRGSPPVTDLKKVKSVDDVANTLELFMSGRADVRPLIINRLQEMRNKIEQSDYFKTHEVIGSSVFIIYDSHKVGAWLIDFAKTNELPKGKTVNHREPWQQGNHEEGLLLGFDKLINILDGLGSKNVTTDSLRQTCATVPVVS